MRSKLTVFLQEAPTIEIDENGSVHVKDDGNEVSVDRVMSIHSLMVYVERGRQRLAEWQAQNGPIEADG
jgi:hypothetical protein